MSAVPPNLPQEIREAAKTVKRLSRLPDRNKAQESELGQARLKIAYFACRHEGVVTSWENLAYILGDGADSIREAYEQMRADNRAKERAAEARRGHSDDDPFWGHAGGRK